MDRLRPVRSRRVLSLLMCVALCFTFALPAAAAETATTVQLKKTEGTVSVSSSSGRSLTLLENMRLYNGYHVETEEESYAWFDLDSAKLSKLDAVSEMELRKSGKDLELLLDSGNLYFNVTEPLESDETLNIRTSTMVVGIRGTSGWVKVVDQWHTRVYILEGTVRCSVTDPVTGQTKVCTLTGGEWADFYVYPQDRAGDKCDIIRQQFSESDIDGFVLAELVGDAPLCDKIYEESGLDLRDLTAEQVGERLASDQKAAADKLQESSQAHASQDHNVNVDPVWTEDSGSSSGSTSSGGGTTAPALPDGVTATTPTTTQSLTMTMPVTIPQIQAALDPANVSSVTVVPGTGDNTLTQLGNETLTVAEGKTLTLESGIDMQVEDPGIMNIAGTMTVNGDLHNYGTITVTSANSLHVNGQFFNYGTGVVNNIDNGHIVPANGIQNSGTINTSGNAVLESGAAATVTMKAADASLSLNGGSISNSNGGSALRWENGKTPAHDLTNSDTTNIWTTTDSAPLSAVIDGRELSEAELIPTGYKVVTNEGQTSLRPTGGVEGGVLIDPVTVTFDANGGRWSGTPPTITVERDRPMGAQSVAPVRTGYTFQGWQDAGGTAYTEDSLITQDVTLYAHWTQNSGGEGPDPAPTTATVTFDANGGSWSGGATVSIAVDQGTSLPYLPESPVRDGYAFTGWQDESGAAFTSATTVADDMTLTAQWTAASATPVPVTVTFDANGGSLDGSDTASITITAGAALPYLPKNPFLSGYHFIGWQDASGNEFTAETVVTANTTLTAQWEAIPVDPGVVAVTFDPDGGRWSNYAQGALSLEPDVLEDGSGYLLPAAPEDPIKAGYTFGGWLCAQSDDDTVYVSGDGIQTVGSDKFVDPAKCTYQRSVTLTAYWLANGAAPAMDRAVTLEEPDSVDEIQRWLDLSSVTEVRITSPNDGYQLAIDKPLYIPDNKCLSMETGDLVIDDGGSLTVALDGGLDMNDRVQAGDLIVDGALYNYGQVYAANISCVNYGGILNLGAGTINGDLTVRDDGCAVMAGGQIDGDLTLEGRSRVDVVYGGQIDGFVYLNDNGQLILENGSIGQKPQPQMLDAERIADGPTGLSMSGGYLGMWGDSYIGYAEQTGGEAMMYNGTIDRMVQDDGDFYMLGGTICVLTSNGGSFELDGGTIIGNVFHNGSFIMWSGTIDGSVIVSSGMFEMYGGTIYGGTIYGGVELNDHGGNPTFTMYNGLIQDGVTIYGGTFEMNGGTILPGQSGAGTPVYIDGGNAYLNGGTIGDIQTTGQALYIYGGSVEIGSDLVIFGNCSDGNGFGVITVDEANGGLLTMNGGVVCNYSNGFAIVVLTDGGMGTTVINAGRFDVGGEQGSDESGGGQDWRPRILLEIASDGTKNWVDLDAGIWDYRALVIYPRPQVRRVRKNKEEGQA